MVNVCDNGNGINHIDSIPNHDTVQITSLEQMISIQDATASTSQVLGIESKLRQLLILERQHSSSDILNFYKTIKYTEPALYRLAEVVLCVPATQVSVERAFSSLPLILSKNRQCMSVETLSNVLFVWLNHELIQNIEL